MRSIKRIEETQKRKDQELVTSKKKISDFEDGIFLLVSRLWPRRIVVGGGWCGWEWAGFESGFESHGVIKTGVN